VTELPTINPAADGPTLMQIASRVLNRPLLLHPTKAEIVLQVLQGRLPLDGAQAAPLSPDANRFLGSWFGEDGRVRKYAVANGVATIPIVGSLVNRGAWIGAYSGMVSYEGISAQLRDAESDPEVQSVLLDIDSPGGEATGMFTVAEHVRQLGQTKPVTAFVNDMAASAAYGIASAANEIVVSPTSIVGSIGVVLTHLDRSGEMEKKGVRATLIYAGKHKVDGNPFGPLSEGVQTDLQAEVMKFYDQFVGLVDRGRAGLTEEAIRATEARTFIGQDAIDRGLADRIASLDAVLSEMQTTMAPGASNRRKGFAMSKTTEAAAPQAEIAGISKADHDAALVSARADARAAGIVEATTRIKTILTCEEAKGREPQAMVLALDTTMSVEDASKVLAASPKVASIASIEERAARENEFGGQASSTPSEKVATGWSTAVAQANKRFG
jgi:signal peptide peptidase SppA